MYVCEAPFHSNTEISQSLQCEIGLEVELHLPTYIHLCEPYTVVSAYRQELVFRFKLYLGDTQTEYVGSGLCHYTTLMYCFTLVLGLDLGLILYALYIY